MNVVEWESEMHEEKGRGERCNDVWSWMNESSIVLSLNKDVVATPLITTISKFVFVKLPRLHCISSDGMYLL